MSLRSFAVASGAVLALLVAAPDLRAACTPGQQSACACPNGSAGAQSCSEDGSRFEPCLCATPVAPAITVYTGRIPDAPKPPSPPGRALFSGGVAMTVLGGLIAPAGFIMLGADLQYRCTHVAVCGAGTAMAIVGTGLLIGGIVAMVVGKNKEAEAAPPSAWIPTSVGFSDRAVWLAWRF